ncbi:MAG: HAMP domain-containing sensor histidine kinase [Bacteroidota bacterium]|uniref:sensor histidine kinase n=1 Tax=Leeuwenhoekiella TaxID=283735 RepID=UPI000EC0DD57|nr:MULTISPECIES: HAMP domain-containing sensor histidine kinase [Leeuwenhoekiella]MEC7783527.1 HAMP domain-containing sensor histidine kinase [Bacteroidota bacterium]MEE3148861.1 HAMP domain-containing sensor histidine kinase [Bacteroidota bacterium]UBZ12110.1 HAMP domain-containing histidine kinase [Leeuwenhoekiella palythoae]HCQ75911.1 two-component sensor histidine kinase [Leeuwenhoekiella sp.]|tara:strand:+ start:337 stop:1491 length:1155 start_codon:yes stop_codon:yes gene_type:complete
MNFNKDQRFIRWFIIFAAVVITALILWNVSLFFDQLKQAERDRMEIWATSMEAFNTEDINQYYALSQKINSKNQYIPIIITDYKDSIVNSINIPENILENPIRSQELLLEMAAENDPIRIDILGGELWYAYYGHSPVINQLKFFPVVLVIIVILFIAVIYFFYATSKASEQNSLWAGMAKETAHQIGTPLSSLVGWTEILKAEQVNPDYIEEINKDINRLETITGRFSQIGSIPKLDPKNIITETQEAFEYLANRSSKLIDFEIDVPQGQLFVMLNKELYAWSIENLVKNAIDAMKGKGKLTLTVKRDTRFAKILIKDTGKGIPKMNFNTIFEPGYTTKKRGWGLGLSLTKRIIEEYHDGQVRVLHSELNKGTTFQIALKLIDE